MTLKSNQPDSSSDLNRLFGDDAHLYQVLFENGNDGFFMYLQSPNGIPNTFVNVNNKACEMLGYSRDDLLRLSPRDLIVPEKWDEVSTIVEKRQQPGGCRVFETTFACHNGREIEVEISDHSFAIEGKAIVLSIVRDQTGRKEAEYRLQLAEIDWNNTFDAITDFVSVHNLDQKIIRANKALVGALGSTREKVIGKYCYEVFHSNGQPWSRCPHLQAIEIGKTVTKIIEENNFGIPLQIQCSPYFDDNGELVGTVHMARDFTERQQAARENERLISELNRALADVKKLSGFLPICASCKKIRDDTGHWHHIETYIKEHSEAEFSHGLCPECSRKLYPYLSYGSEE